MPNKTSDKTAYIKYIGPVFQNFNSKKAEGEEATYPLYDVGVVLPGSGHLAVVH